MWRVKKKMFTIDWSTDQKYQLKPIFFRSNFRFCQKLTALLLGGYTKSSQNYKHVDISVQMKDYFIINIQHERLLKC